MELTGASALTLLSRYGVPTVLGPSIDIEPDRAAVIEPVNLLLRHYRLRIGIERSSAQPRLTLGLAESRVQQTALVDPLLGLHAYQVTAMANTLEFPRETWQRLAEFAQALFRAFVATDALNFDIHRFGIDQDGSPIVLQAFIELDDNASFRHSEFVVGSSSEPDAERLARMAGISYARLDGQIGCVANGAGMAMATMDLVAAFGQPYGLRPASFMDIGGGARSDTVEVALRILLQYHHLSALVFNIFGGITRADEIAQGIIAACGESGAPFPFVLYSHGTNSLSARARLEQSALSNLHFAESLSGSAEMAVTLAGVHPQ